MLRSVHFISFILLLLFRADASITPTQILGNSQSDRWYWIELSHEFKQTPSPLVKLYEQTKGEPFQYKTPLEYSGLLKSAYIHNGKLNLAYNRNVFTLKDDKTTELVFSVPAKNSIWAMMSDNDDLFFLTQDEQNQLNLKKKDQTEISLKSLKNLKGNFYIPFSGNQFIIILGLEFDLLNTHFTSIEMRDGVAHIWEHTFEKETFSNVSLIDDQVWLIPKNDGKIRTWKKGDRQFGNLDMPYPSSDQVQWISATKVKDDIAWLGYHINEYRIRESKTSEEIIFPNDNKKLFEKFFNQNNTSHTLLQLALIFTLGYIYRRRRKKELELIKERKLAENIIPANLLLRCMAFLFDFIIIYTPINMIYVHLYGADFFYLQALSQRSFFFMQDSYLLAYYYHTVTLIFFYVFIFGTYQGLMDYFCTGSLGKLFFRIAIYNDSGEKPTLQQIIIKSIFRAIDTFFIIGLFVALFSKKNKSISDKIAKTMIGRRTYL